MAANASPSEQHPTSEQEYEEVLARLNSLIRTKRRADGGSWEEAAAKMPSLLRTIGLREDDLDRLRVVHVAGTKGKGSTCAMVENILRACGYRTGLFTSPHMCDFRERIRLDGLKVSKARLVQSFRHCYEMLERSGELSMAGFFRFATLLALKTFVVEGVDVVILEVGLGGRLDATNAIPHPVVCGVTSLGYDHMEFLGNTLFEIATEKAGIFKVGSPALTVSQEPEAMRALERRAEELGVSLQTVRPIDSFQGGSDDQCGGQFPSNYQRVNAALAVALATQWELRTADEVGSKNAKERLALLESNTLPREYIEGLREFQWPGRAQIIEDGHNPSTAGDSDAKCGESKGLTFYLDGAHTPESLSACAEWFADQAGQANARERGEQERQGECSENILLFNCMSERDPKVLLGSLNNVLLQKGIPIHRALFVPPESNKSSMIRTVCSSSVDLSWQREQCREWQRLRAHVQPTIVRPKFDGSIPVAAGCPFPDSRRGAVVPTLRSALQWIRTAPKLYSGIRFRVLVTGSLYLVGDVLQLLDRAPR
ncbi:unnamed protein product [Ostreobium quekettii]|uniref:Folylpolyglutamate synthase n=1 Tax=Ostreobium quekettii TaxID=121088 RepID=A0A8S1IL36_9CHLO|nr:unnamed protein product [Ostreobium quekettii]